MVKFADEALIEVRAGNGVTVVLPFDVKNLFLEVVLLGAMAAKGGDVLFVLNETYALWRITYKRVFKAKNGADGQGSQKYGRDGEDVLIPLPPGSIIKRCRNW